MSDERPVTGHERIDAALASVDLTGDADTHHEQLARALETVQQVLTEAQQPQPRR
ncbi:hypothetical protein [Nigerium massiliense]|uniref:hypothetical protein n=1 Tax=Nigerium massiliense TaxID=1522317 RepID=UPI0012FDC6EC|nr:hypothetical protein [Nigerium massiliense]